MPPGGDAFPLLTIDGSGDETEAELEQADEPDEGFGRWTADAARPVGVGLHGLCTTNSTVPLCAGSVTKPPMTKQCDTS